MHHGHRGTVPGLVVGILFDRGPGIEYAALAPALAGTLAATLAGGIPRRGGRNGGRGDVGGVGSQEQ